MQGIFNMHKRKHEEDRSSHEQHKNKQRKEESQSQPSTTAKISNLLEALKDLSKEPVIETIGQQSWDKILDLQLHITEQVKLQNLDLSTPSQNYSVAPAYPGENIPHMLSGLQLSSMKSHDIPTRLPELPEILNKTLEKAVFTHQGTGTGSSMSMNYEKLEWIGDTYIEHSATIFISQTFVSLSPGQCSQLRERFVKNVTLADFAKQYGFLERANLPSYILDSKAHKAAKDSSRTKVLGDIFEAYVAAIVLSDPAFGLATATQWIKDLLSMTLKDDIIREENHGQYGRIDSPLWNLKWSPETTKSSTTVPKIDLNPKELLATAIGYKGITIEYKDMGPPSKDKNKAPVFPVGVYMTGWGEKNRLLGVGNGGGKKQAGFAAAEAALKDQKLIKRFADMKKTRVELDRREKDILVKQGGPA